MKYHLTQSGNHKIDPDTAQNLIETAYAEDTIKWIEQEDTFADRQGYRKQLAQQRSQKTNGQKRQKCGDDAPIGSAARSSNNGPVPSGDGAVTADSIGRGDRNNHGINIYVAFI